MNYLSKTKHLIILVFALIAFGACEENNEKPDQKDDVKSKYMVHLRVGISGDETADYILTDSSLTQGTISAEGRGIEQTGWRYSAHTENTLLSIGYYDDNNAIGYGINDKGELFEKGKFTFETTLDVFSDGNNGMLTAMEVPRSGFADRVFHLIDGEEVKVTKKVGTRIYEDKKDSLVAWPTALVKRDEKMYVPFYKLHADGSFATPETDTAMVAVYTYPGLTFEKYIKDPRMGPIGIYGNKRGMVKTESGDLYAYSSASFACGFTTQQDNSGILRIKSNESTFDDSYFFNVEEKTGKKLAYIEYVGNGLAVGRLIPEDENTGLWSYYGSADICELVVLDLENKTVTPIDGVPLHKGQYAPMMVENGNVIVNISTSQDAHIYKIDPKNATAEQGAEIQGMEVQNMVKIEY